MTQSLSHLGTFWGDYHSKHLVTLIAALKNKEYL